MFFFYRWAFLAPVALDLRTTCGCVWLKFLIFGEYIECLRFETDRSVLGSSSFCSCIILHGIDTTFLIFHAVKVVVNEVHFSDGATHLLV